MIALTLAAVATGVVSEVLVKSIEPVVHDWGLPRAFIGFVLVPFVGNVPEHFSAVRLAYRDSVDFAMGISFGSAIQVALFASSVAVFASLIVGHHLTLVFPPLELGALAAAGHRRDAGRARRRDQLAGRPPARRDLRAGRGHLLAFADGGRGFHPTG